MRLAVMVYLRFPLSRGTEGSQKTVRFWRTRLEQDSEPQRVDANALFVR
jgi:hypothetical protein